MIKVDILFLVKFTEKFNQFNYKKGISYKQDYMLSLL